jgi:hypothetical protein
MEWVDSVSNGLPVIQGDICIGRKVVRDKFHVLIVARCLGSSRETLPKSRNKNEITERQRSEEWRILTLRIKGIYIYIYTYIYIYISP